MTCVGTRRGGRGAAVVLAPALAMVLAALGGCASAELGDPETALPRLEGLIAEGELDEATDLGGALVESDQAHPKDKAEGAFITGEAEFALGRHARAFERYRYVLENAPWSEHALAIEERLYEIGQVMLFSDEYSGWFSDRGRGVEALETLQAHFRTSDRADDALKLVGDYFASDDVAEYGEAALAYLRVVDEYPDSEWAERCLWLAGHMRLAMAGGPEYDRNDLLRARELLERSQREHPHGVAAAEVREDLTLAIELLAAAEIVVADFYARRDVPPGEQLHLANAALLYPQTESGQRARQRLLALGIDVDLLADDPSRSSIDKVKAVRPRWEQERESARTGEEEP